jgi:UDP-N-acetylmuramate dehydrogenase
MMVAQHVYEVTGRVLLDEPMARHSSWKTGGCAARYYEPADIEDLQLFLRGLDPREPLTWVGLGSNLLVRDGGLRGTVIAPAGRLRAVQLQGDGAVRAEAGVYCAQVARFCAAQGLAGAVFLAGIPGTLGGALAMNAGAFGGETWQRVRSVETIDRQGRLRVRGPDEYQVGYRSVSGPAEEWFVAGILELEPGDPDTLNTRMRELLRKRGATQPTNQPSCGSVFRNPPGDFAARLIESAGLKGAREGGAEVSTKHANFIVNASSATARDIETLIERVQRAVEQTHGIRLLREVRIVGEPANAEGSGR